MAMRWDNIRRQLHHETGTGGMSLMQQLEDGIPDAELKRLIVEHLENMMIDLQAAHDQLFETAMDLKSNLEDADDKLTDSELDRFTEAVAGLAIKSVFHNWL